MTPKGYTRVEIAKRNRRILAERKRGATIDQLAQQFNLSSSAVRGVIYSKEKHTWNTGAADFQALRDELEQVKAERDAAFRELAYWKERTIPAPRTTNHASVSIAALLDMIDALADQRPDLEPQAVINAVINRSAEYAALWAEMSNKHLVVSAIANGRKTPERRKS